MTEGTDEGGVGESRLEGVRRRLDERQLRLPLPVVHPRRRRLDLVTYVIQCHAALQQVRLRTKPTVLTHLSVH